MRAAHRVGGGHDGAKQQRLQRGERCARAGGTRRPDQRADDGGADAGAGKGKGGNGVDVAEEGGGVERVPGLEDDGREQGEEEELCGGQAT